MSSDLGYYAGMSITAALGTHTFIEIHKTDWWVVVLMAIAVLFYSIVGGIVGAIIQDTAKKIYDKWNGRKRSQKQPSGV